MPPSPAPGSVLEAGILDTWRKGADASPRPARAPKLFRSRGADPEDALGVEAVDRLIEHEHLRIAEQRGDDAQALVEDAERRRSKTDREPRGGRRFLLAGLDA